MADPRTLEKDSIARRWDRVLPVMFCPACLGSLPPDSRDACSTCGTGTPTAHREVLTVGPHLVAVERDDTGRWTSAVTLHDELAGFDDAPEEILPPASAPLTWWQRFARWPHG